MTVITSKVLAVAEGTFFQRPVTLNNSTVYNQKGHVLPNLILKERTARVDEQHFEINFQKISFSSNCTW